MSVIYFILQQISLLIIPLLTVTLGGMFSEWGGIVNIALEGIMTMGALTGVLLLNMTGGKISGQFQLVLTTLIAMATGGVLMLFHAYAAIDTKAGQVTSGTALNMFAPVLTIFVARVTQGVRQIQFTNTLRLESVPVLGRIPAIGPMLFQNAYTTIYIGIAILAISAMVFYRTRFGLRLRSCGGHPQAADAAGINVYRMQYAGAVTPGALAGLEGLVFVVPTSTNFNATAPGYGFLTLAVLTFGQWKPVKILYASLFFGLMKAVAFAYSGIPLLAGLGVPSYFCKMVPYIATLVVLILMSKNSQMPRASGVPYDKGQK